MKKILITGANSYIGVSFEKYIKNTFPNNYRIDTFDMIEGAWRDKDFSGYDTVFHVSGIAHADVGKVSDEQQELYYKVNRDLTIETAIKAKRDGVKQFIFMSSSIVYGESAPIGKKKVITNNTLPSPSSFYGNSKLQAEKGLEKLQDENFNVVIIRSPMIYGKNSRGNYPALSKIAQKLPIFPFVNNERSMIYIENLCEFVRLLIKNNEYGVFYPQNGEYSNTTELVKTIAETHGKKIIIIKGFGWTLRIMRHLSKLVDKAFGNLTYDMSISEYKENYRICNFKESIERTEV